MKELYDNEDRYTEEGRVVRKEIDELIAPMFVRLYKEGYRPRDIQSMFDEGSQMQAVWCRAGMHDEEDEEELTE